MAAVIRKLASLPLSLPLIPVDSYISRIHSRPLFHLQEASVNQAVSTRYRGEDEHPLNDYNSTKRDGFTRDGLFTPFFFSFALLFLSRHWPFGQEDKSKTWRRSVWHSFPQLPGARKGSRQMEEVKAKPSRFLFLLLPDNTPFFICLWTLMRPRRALVFCYIR